MADIIIKNYAVIKVELNAEALTYGDNQLGLSIQSRANATDEDDGRVMSIYIDINYINHTTSNNVFHTITMVQFDIDESKNDVDMDSMRMAFTKAAECTTAISKQANLDLPDLPTFDEAYRNQANK